MAFAGVNTNLIPKENGGVVIVINCNQKFTMNTFIDLLKVLRTNKELLAKVHETDLYNDGLSIEMDYCHKHYTIGIVDQIKHYEMLEEIDERR